MLINPNQILLSYDGKPIVTSETDSTPYSLKTVMINALSFPVNDEEGTAHVKKELLKIAIYQAKEELDIPIEDLVLIKSLIAKAFYQKVSGPALMLLPE